MFSFHILFPLLLLCPFTIATAVLFPDYIYPYPASAWAPLYTSLATYPTLRHEVIVNPNSGPGGPPNSDYTSAMTTLKSYPNAIPLGYVDTATGTRPAAAIESDINTWSAWPSGVRPTGIFFDDVDNGTTAGSTAIMTQVAAFARSAGFTSKIVFNPGAIPVPSAQAALFAAADQIIVYENNYASYAGQANAVKALKNGGVAGRQMSLIVYGLADTGTALGALVANTTGECYGSVYLTDAGDYTSFGADWGNFTQAMNAAL